LNTPTSEYSLVKFTGINKPQETFCIGTTGQASDICPFRTRMT
jgi:hypothetical protein